ncbi:MAG: tetratricopeptide repeat protein [Fermentimonas sp.]|jgi:tetratricopeptide (TPR) repeat protein
MSGMRGRLIIIFSGLLFIATANAQSTDYMGWVDKAADYIETDMLDSAAVALETAMRLDPANANNSVLLLNLGILQRQLGNLDDAYISFTSSMSNNPMPRIVLHNRASLLVEMNRFEEAKEDYSALVRNYPDDVEAYYRRGVLYLEEHDRKSAEADFRKSEEIDPDNMFTKLSKALLYKLDNNWVEAEKVYTALINETDSPDASIYLNRAECYVNTGQSFLASADLRSIESSQRNNPYYYFLRGRVRLDQFDKQAARADFVKAKEMGYNPAIVDEWIARTKR